jgi:hypothetical protein
MKQKDENVVSVGWGQVGYGEAYRASGFAGESWVLMDEERCIRRTRHRHWSYQITGSSLSVSYKDSEVEGEHNRD